jgi:AcrR family transcriptional regulator
VAEELKLSKGEKTRSRILVAAEHRFAEFGFVETRIEDVAKDAGIATSAVLYHFADKRALYDDVVVEVFSGLFADLQRSLAGAGDLSTRIEAAAETFIDHAVHRPSTASLTLREIVAPDQGQRPEFVALASSFLDALQLVFEKENRSRRTPIQTDPLHFASAVAGAVLFYISAVPTFAPNLPYPHLAPEQVAMLKRDTIAIAHRLLGTAS